MYVKKSGGVVWGAALTAAERKALNIEIGKQTAEYNRMNELEIDAIVLWRLHTEFGFGENRLRRFYFGLKKDMKELTDRYELNPGDEPWLCYQLFKQKGIDISEWNEEVSNEKL